MYAINVGVTMADYEFQYWIANFSSDILVVLMNKTVYYLLKIIQKFWLVRAMDEIVIFVR